MPERHWAFGSKERYILNLLGFRGLYPFSKACGVHHETCGTILGTMAAKWRSRPQQIAKVHQTLHAAFRAKREALTKGELALILEWHPVWKQYIMGQFAITAVGKIKTKPQPQWERVITSQKHKDRTDAMQATLDALVWE